MCNLKLLHTNPTLPIRHCGLWTSKYRVGYKNQKMRYSMWYDISMHRQCDMIYPCIDNVIWYIHASTMWYDIYMHRQFNALFINASYFKIHRFCCFLLWFKVLYWDPNMLSRGYLIQLKKKLRKAATLKSLNPKSLMQNLL